VDERQEHEFVTVQDGACRLGMSERSAWDVVRRSAVGRYRLPGQEKTTFVIWSEFERAYKAPRPIGPLGTEDDVTKKAAA